MMKFDSQSPVTKENLTRSIADTWFLYVVQVQPAIESKILKDSIEKALEWYLIRSFTEDSTKNQV